MKKFELSHVVLYSKDWYHKTDDIFRDLRFALTLDGYSGEFFTNKDIVRKLLQECSDIDSNYFTMDQIYCGVQKNQTHMANYVHKDSPIYVTNHIDKPILNEYDIDIAIIMYLISGLRFLEHSRWKNKKPIYGEGLGKPYKIQKKDVEKMFRNI